MRKLLSSLAFVAAALVPAAAFAGALSTNGFIVATGDGTLVRSSFGYSVTHVSTGRYEVDVLANVHSCAYSVTAGSGDATIAPPAIATSVGRVENSNAIMIATFDSKGAYVDSGFHLIVRCLDATTDGAAVVDADGTLARGIFANGATRTGVGAYTVTFANSAASGTCAYTAAVGLSATSGTSDPGFVNVAAVSGGTIAVRTYDRKGRPVDLGFHVFAMCNL